MVERAADYAFASAKAARRAAEEVYFDANHWEEGEFTRAKGFPL